MSDTTPNDFVGMTEDDAFVKAKDDGYRIRIIKRDGVSFNVTLDAREDRINFNIEQGVVVEASVG